MLNLDAMMKAELADMNELARLEELDRLENEAEATGDVDKIEVVQNELHGMLLDWLERYEFERVAGLAGSYPYDCGSQWAE